MPVEQNFSNSRLPDRPDWSLVSEFTIPPKALIDGSSFDQIEKELLPLKLHAEQVISIQTAIHETWMIWRTKNKHGHADFPLQVKLYSSEIGGDPDRSASRRQKKTNRYGGGLSFFLIKRIPGELYGSSKNSAYVIDVLIYSE